MSWFYKSPYHFVRSVCDSCHTAEPLLGPHNVYVARTTGLVTVLLFTKIRSSFCNMSSYNQSSWIVLLTFSRLLVSVRIMVLSTAPCRALELKCGRENLSGITGGMEWATSLSCATAQQRNKVQPGGVGHFMSILLNYVYFLPSSNGHVDFSKV